MELWQLDVMGGIWLVDGRELKAVTGLWTKRGSGPEWFSGRWTWVGGYEALGTGQNRLI
jgi:hypothetical protein